MILSLDACNKELNDFKILSYPSKVFFSLAFSKILVLKGKTAFIVEGLLQPQEMSK